MHPQTLSQATASLIVSEVCQVKLTAEHGTIELVCALQSRTPPLFSLLPYTINPEIFVVKIFS